MVCVTWAYYSIMCWWLQEIKELNMENACDSDGFYWILWDKAHSYHTDVNTWYIGRCIECTIFCILLLTHSIILLFLVLMGAGFFLMHYIFNILVCLLDTYMRDIQAWKREVTPYLTTLTILIRPLTHNINHHTFATMMSRYRNLLDSQIPIHDQN